MRPGTFFEGKYDRTLHIRILLLLKKQARKGVHIEEITWHTLVIFPDTVSRAPLCSFSLQFSGINNPNDRSIRSCSHITWVKFGVFQTLLSPSSAIVSNYLTPLPGWTPHPTLTADVKWKKALSFTTNQLLSKTWGHSAQVLAVWPPQVTNADESVPPGCWKKIQVNSWKKELKTLSQAKRLKSFDYYNFHH